MLTVNLKGVYLSDLVYGMLTVNLKGVYLSDLVYGMTQSSPMLLLQAMGKRVTTCTTEVIVSAKASRT